MNAVNSIKKAYSRYTAKNQ